MNETDRAQRLKAADVVDDYHHGLIGRRRLMLMLAQLGFGSMGLLGGCRKPAPAEKTDDKRAIGPNSAIDPLTDQHRFLKDIGRTFAGTTLRIVGENTPSTQATIDIMKKEFIPVTGINVEWEQLPLDRVLAKVAADTARKAGTHDIFYWDQAWIGRFIDDAIDLHAMIAKKDLGYPGFNFDDILPPLVEHVASYKGRLGGIPFDIPICITIYRKDVFAELGLSVPKTIPQYLEVVKAIQKAKAPSMFGTTESWKAGHYSLLQRMTTWLWGHGGSFFGADERPAITSDKARAGMEFMMELGKYMPPGNINRDWFGEAESFARGKAGIYTGIGEFFPSYDDPAHSSVVGLADVAPSPAALDLRPRAECGFDEAPGMSHHGGSSLALSRHGKHVDAAWIFLQWATSPDVTTRASLDGGGASPIRYSNYSDPRIKEKARVTAGTTRHFDVTLDAIMNHLGTEPHLPAWAGLAVDSFAVELGKMTTGQQSVKTTLANMANAADKAIASGKATVSR